MQSTMRSRAQGRGSRSLRSMCSAGGAKSAYVHIPFCNQRCFYCDFPISIVGKGYDTSAVQSKMDRYIDSLVVEIRNGGEGPMAPRAAGDSNGHGPLRTVYFGGGTPSLLSPQQLGRVLDALHLTYGIQEGAEVTVEMDPGTFGLDKAIAFRSMGVTRASMGVQSFDEGLLKAAGRGHGVHEVFESYRFLMEAGFLGVSLDLMSGLPGQTMELFENSLKQAVSLGPSHMSVYDLIVEDNTAFGRWYGPTGLVPPGMSGSDLPEEDLSADMYRAADSILSAAGYEHYEVSNYALCEEGEGVGGIPSRHRSRHNSVYWLHKPFISFGMGATSYVGGKRFKRPATLSGYLEWVERGGGADGLVDEGGDDDDEEEEEEGPQAKLAEALMVGMRVSDGVDLHWAREEFGHVTVSRALKALEKHIDSGLVSVMPSGLNGDGGERVMLTRPEGFLFSNTVLVSLFELEEEEEDVDS